MIEIPIIDAAGKQVGSERLDPELLGGRVRYSLLKQAVVAYRANLRVGTVQTKSRGDVHGASKKLYRQKGTGRARAGNLRTPVRVGGGHAFAKKNRDFSQKMNRKSRRLARDSAILAKALSGSAKILKDMAFDRPQTRKMVGLLAAADSGRSALITIGAPNDNLVKSGRNIPKVDIKLIADVNAYDVLRAKSLVFTPESFAALSSGLTTNKSE
ncbi:MAG TPA: 50S ribosomal protein L4 [Phycisphaerae bacterium]|mgnify:CR=1 FL=1|nr:50S ribosomal protein L4 [Phycisphaerae bacterium]HRW53285.1 50S ribosomal protein L4 [Phycisphaerae bacterium]